MALVSDSTRRRLACVNVPCSGQLGLVSRSQQQPSGLSNFSEMAGPVTWHSLPSSYAISGRDQMVDLSLQRSMATNIGATIVTFPAASHAGGSYRRRRSVRQADRGGRQGDRRVSATTTGVRTPSSTSRRASRCVIPSPLATSPDRTRPEPARDELTTEVRQQRSG